MAQVASGIGSRDCGLVNDQKSGRNWQLYLGDSCEILPEIPENSVGLGIHSPPFSQLYIYSDSIADMGNSSDHEEFAEHYSYVVRELFRVTMPGRLCVVHCKDLPLYKGRDGAMGLFDFPGLCHRIFLDAGWIYHSRVTIWKDPVTEMQRTKNHGLLYKELCKDSCGSRQGMADYLLVFRKWDGDFANPVNIDGERFDHYVGLEPPDAEQCLRESWRDGDDIDVPMPTRDAEGRWPKFNPFPVGSVSHRFWSIRCWQKYASPVWFDIHQMNVLNQRAARDDSDEKHICPLQLDLIERCIHLWSNQGDVVFSPFVGIGSEIHVAVKCGRKGLGIELKDSYFNQACEYLRQLERDMGQPRLF